MSTQVKSTITYDIFKQVVSNREVDPRHVKKLVKAIQKNNMLHLNPIIVNEQMEVFEGQHRLEAAQTLGVPIYYIVDSKITKTNISELNSVKKSWGIMDFINYWTIEKATGFDRLSAFLAENSEIQASTAMILLSSDGTRNIPALREGRIDVANYQQACAVALVLKSFRNFIDWAYNRNFILAIYNVINTGKYDHDRMLSKLEFQSRSLVKCINVKQYIEMLEEIYNFKSREDNKVSFKYSG